MYLHADTVITPADFSEGDKEDKTRVAAPRLAHSDKVERAMAVLGTSLPPLPPQWKAQAAGQPVPSLHAVSHAPAANTAHQAQRRAPSELPLSAPRKTLTNLLAARDTGVTALPFADFEPSVVEQIPQPPRVQFDAAPVAADPWAAQVTKGRIIAMFSCRGGAGTTTLTVNAAAQLARQGKSVCVVDLDLQLGDVFVALDLEAQTSLAAIAREASTIDGAALKRRLARHDSGVYALSQAGHLDDIDSSLVERLPALMSTLSDHFDYVLIDGIRDFGDYALGVLDVADEIAMVLTQDVPSVRRAARAINLFRRLGYGESRVRLVLNRAGGGEISEDAVMRALAMPLSARVRNDHKPVRKALNAGALVSVVAPSSKVVRDVDAFTQMIRRHEQANPHLAAARAGTHPAAQQTAPVKKSLFSFLRRGGK